MSDSAFAYFTDKGIYGADLTGRGWFCGLAARRPWPRCTPAAHRARR